MAALALPNKGLGVLVGLLALGTSALGTYLAASNVVLFISLAFGTGTLLAGCAACRARFPWKGKRPSPRSADCPSQNHESADQNEQRTFTETRQRNRRETLATAMCHRQLPSPASTDALHDSASSWQGLQRDACWNKVWAGPGSGIPLAAAFLSQPASTEHTAPADCLTPRLSFPVRHSTDSLSFYSVSTSSTLHETLFNLPQLSSAGDSLLPLEITRYLLSPTASFTASSQTAASNRPSMQHPHVHSTLLDLGNFPHTATATAQVLLAMGSKDLVAAGDPQDLSTSSPEFSRMDTVDTADLHPGVAAEYVSPLGERKTISIKISTSHQVTDLPRDTAQRLQDAMDRFSSARAAHAAPALVTRLATRPGCVRIVLEASRPPRRTQPASMGANADPAREAADTVADYEKLAVEVVQTLGLDAGQLSHMDHVDIQVDGMLVRATWDAAQGCWTAACTPLHAVPGMPSLVQATFVDEPQARLIPPSSGDTLSASRPPTTGPLAVAPGPTGQLVVNCIVSHSAGLQVAGYAPPPAGSKEGTPVHEGPGHGAGQDSGTHGGQSPSRHELQVLVQMQGGYLPTYVTQQSGELSIPNPDTSGLEQEQQLMAELLVTADLPAPLSPTAPPPTWCKLELWCDGLLLDTATLLLGPAQLPPAPRSQPLLSSSLRALADRAPTSLPFISSQRTSAHARGAGADHSPDVHGSELSTRCADQAVSAMYGLQGGGVYRGKQQSASAARWLSDIQTSSDHASRSRCGPASHMDQGGVLSFSPSQSLTMGQALLGRLDLAGNEFCGFLTDGMSGELIPSASTEAMTAKGVQQRVRDAWRGAVSPAISSQMQDGTGRAAFKADLATWESMLGDSEAQLFMEAVAEAKRSGNAVQYSGIDSSPLLRMSLSPALLSHAAVLAKALLRHAVRHGMRGVAKQLMTGMQSPAGQRLLSLCTPSPMLSDSADSLNLRQSSSGTGTSALHNVIDTAEAVLLQQLAESSGDTVLLDELTAWLKQHGYASHRCSLDAAQPQGLGVGMLSAGPAATASMDRMTTTGTLSPAQSRLSDTGAGVPAAVLAKAAEETPGPQWWPQALKTAAAGALDSSRTAVLVLLAAVVVAWENYAAAPSSASLALSLALLLAPPCLMRLVRRSTAHAPSGQLLPAALIFLAAARAWLHVGLGQGWWQHTQLVRDLCLVTHLYRDLVISPSLLAVFSQVPLSWLLAWQSGTLVSLVTVAKAAQVPVWSRAATAGATWCAGLVLPLLMDCAVRLKGHSARPSVASSAL